MKVAIIVSLFLILTMSAFGAIGETTESDIPDTYEYITTVDVLCSEYRGYARFELPDTLNANQLYESNIDQRISIERSYVSLIQLSDWFVTTIEGYDIRQTEALYDNNIRTDLIVENGEITLPLQNPRSQQISQISIQMADSLLSDIQIEIDGESVFFTQSQRGFYYQLELNEPVTTDSVDVIVSFDGIAKIAEVTLSYEQNSESNYGYFYVDNNCNETVVIYHGMYGEGNTFTSGSQSLPVNFPTVVRNSINPLYDSDFDDDGVENTIDNCLNTPNTDQKDIDYNKRGDACQDADRDGIFDLEDNCPNRYNPDQYDFDTDGTGDACDEEDNRFFEENAPFVYILGFLIAVVFVVFAIRIMKQK